MTIAGMSLALNLKDHIVINLLMPTPFMTYTTKGNTHYTADQHGIVSVQPQHTHELVAMGGVPLPPKGWVDPR